MEVIKYGLQWKEVPRAHGPPKTLYNRFVRWSRMDVFSGMLSELAGQRDVPERRMIDATHLKAHRTAASRLKKGLFPAASVGRRAAHHVRSPHGLAPNRYAL
jgi:transposase